MFLIRSIAQAQSGRRDEAVALLKEFGADMQKAVGAPPCRILTGSIGLPDSTVVMEHQLETLAKFEQQIEAINKWEGMPRYGKKFAEIMISGSHRFEILRLY